ncbi:hypothetical protein O7622_01150 [Micromonospora sp. WMMD1076]|uniref:HNH endonuclease n=1 Tax=Micromonospora sp. WMMD1076 TaxID=3016103 RepID=UPI00249B40F3|nr:hypothetical protein [Micromonospora sp. WMMD1076]WFF07237.1 hypothetical protein O7622_01150 [Micromonospora sp. WMMD1076]
MPWAKFSDTSASHPVVLAPAALTDWQPARLTQTDLVNLLFGFFGRLAVQSAGYTTDYIVKAGTVASAGGDNWQHWVTLAVQVGYLTPIPPIDGQAAWRLIDDSTHLAHIRLKDELDWERQRRADNGNPVLTVPVRLRDGDACRYCGVVINWGDQKGGRGATYDHRNPGKQATSPDDLRVACRACNARRKDHPDADDWCPPRPAPAEPYYSARTVTWLAEHGHQVRRGRTPRPATQTDPAPTTPRPARQADPAPRDPAPSRTPRPAPPSTDRDPAPRRTPRPATPPPAGSRTPRPGRRPDTAPRDPAAGGTTRSKIKNDDQHGLANPSNRLTAGSGSPGREGHGTGAHAPSPATPHRNRRRRGRRGRPPAPKDQHG